MCICQICNQKYNSNQSLILHVIQKHNITAQNYYDKFIKKINEGYCLNCGKPTNFISSNIGYRKFCSNKCTMESEQTINKRENTNLLKYGANNQFENEIIKEKSKKTKLEKYGSKTYNNTTKRLETRSKQREERINKIIKEKEFNFNIVHLESELYIFHCNNERCNKDFIITRQMFLIRLKQNCKEICNYCHPYLNYTLGSSKGEQELKNFIKKYYFDEVDNKNRIIVKPHEIDLYLPKIKMAFEFNGIFWHSDYFKDKTWDYHLNKTNICEKQNIHLIHIYEDDWACKQEIIKSNILDLLGLYQNTYNASQCSIKIVINDDAKLFLNNNHLKEYDDKATLNLGLYYNNIIVTIMSFKDYELVRMCNKLNINVINGYKTILLYFIKNYKYNKIVTFADRSWIMNNGANIYDLLGFKFVEIIKPTFSYIVNEHKEIDLLKSRQLKLMKLNIDQISNLKFNKIYDSGHLKYEWMQSENEID